MNPKYIFCATNFFSGSKALSFAFGFSKDFLSANSFTKRDSLYRKFVVDLYYSRRTEEVKEIFGKKNFARIEDSLCEFKKARYFESDPFFIRLFAKTACENLGKEMAIIHLINNPIYVSCEIYDSEEILKPFLFSHLSKNNIIKPNFLKYREYQHEFFRIFWHCLETYARSKELISRYKNIKHYVFFTKWLLIPFELKALLKSFRINLSSGIIKTISEIYKEEEISMKNREYSLSIDEALGMAIRFIDRFGDQFMLSKEECLQLLDL